MIFRGSVLLRGRPQGEVLEQRATEAARTEGEARSWMRCDSRRWERVSSV